ncbi:uncharacterized protein K444DRAFT_639408 [Hyaloscypha bicolor E]|uniref:C2H2-type domain-containing protein n=1 Tax=Hyaloscypha bicolor E TaxID=1095630 RepID=A0A2J6TWP2_9HELO|nr:uncharacterized protein K444DRAFT_639408 [Hyaloscypha bicolor E]PMD67452.1 hypothetical protein K444DRAFT_639408 [Hyaloscypha bicolor E]
MSSRCVLCDQSFDSEEALQQHLRDSPAHTPSFDCEDCDRSFGNEEALEQHLRDSRIHQKDTETPLDVFFRSFPTFDYDPSLPLATSVASDDAWNRYQDALQSELHLWYGTENDLTAWHALCRAISIDPLPKTLQRTHVNIEKVRTFRDIAELRTYTKEIRKIFRNTFDQEGGNVVLRHLLRKIFRGSL